MLELLVAVVIDGRSEEKRGKRKKMMAARWCKKRSEEGSPELAGGGRGDEGGLRDGVDQI